MKAIVEHGKVIALVGDTQQGLDKLLGGLEEVELSGREDQPSIGWYFEDGKFSPPSPEPRNATLADLKNSVRSIVEHEVSARRQALVKDVYGQLQVYTAKYHEARAYKVKALGEELANYVWISAEVAATGEDADAVADVMIAKYTEMASNMAALEEIARRARLSLDSDSTDDTDSVHRVLKDAMAAFKKLWE